MALSFDLVGARTDPAAFRYSWRDAVLYALGVGARVDGELDLLYEARGPAVLPTFGVIPSFDTMAGLVARLGHDPAMLLHGEQELVCHRPLPPAGELETTGVVRAIYDKGKGALVVIDTDTAIGGERLATNTYSLYIRGEGGFGGERGPKSPPAPIVEGPPAFEVVEATSPEQAALYRLSGDLNPIHIDPDVAAAGKLERPILHGLCTFGHAGRAIVARACGGDPARLRSLRVRFTGVVFPGDTLTTRGWIADDQVVVEVEASNPGAGSRAALTGVAEVA